MAGEKPGKRLIERLREEIRSRHYSRRTEAAYWYWVRYFILFHDKRHPAQMGAAEVTAFLSWLATERNVAAATQNQALSALLFLYRHVLGQALPWLDEIVRAQRPVRLPVVLSEAEVRRLLESLEGAVRIMTGLLYGAGLWQIECLSLRVKDIDFAYRQIIVREGKGARDRATMLPENLVQPLQKHLGKVRLLHRGDWREGYGEVCSRMRCRESTRARAVNGRGSSSFPRAAARPIRKAVRCAGTTCIRTRWGARSSARRGKRAS